MTLHRITKAALLDVLHPKGLTPNEARVLFILAAARGPVSRKELADALYEDAADGGPDWAKECVRVFVYGLREKGYGVGTRWGWGYYLEYEPAPAKRKRAA